MRDEMDILKIIMSITLILFIATMIFVAIFNSLIPRLKKIRAIDNAYAGEIIDKEIINANAGLFSSSDMDYRLIIRVEYKDGKTTKKAEKSISVDKETYTAAEIGDWFDSHTLEITKPESKENK